VNAAVSRGFRPGFTTDPFFETKQTAQAAWDSLVFDDANDAIGSLPGGHRHAEGVARYAFIRAGPWMGFEKLIEAPAVQPAVQPAEQPSQTLVGEPAAYPVHIEVQSTDDWSASDGEKEVRAQQPPADPGHGHGISAGRLLRTGT
ncbi:hypothetical protein NEUTE2DRAFT_50485, partial [Neurospora tetrasperma FGSC 2509]